MLFILEEGASFWSTDLTWRTFFCSSVTLLTVIIMDRSLNFAGEDMTSNFSFGKFSEVSSFSAEAGGGGHAYLIIELSLFLLMGCIGGLLGGIFVSVNGFLARLRKKYVTTPWRRLVEILVLASLTAWMTFTVPLIWSVCSNMPENAADDDTADFSRDEVYLVQRLVQFDCPRGQYNQVASLFYVDSNTAIKLLFHFREHMSAETFDTGSLLVVLVPYFVLACATCGIAASAGVFVSCLVSGAVMGRLFGHLLYQHFAHQGLSDAGTYALVGAAAMIGGVCRNTISLTVMMVEATGSLDYVLPIMLALLSAKYVGDLLSPGLYNNLVKVRDLPWLAESIWGTSTTGGGTSGSGNSTDITSLHLQPIASFMATPVVYLRDAETVGNVRETLQTTTHNLFPVLDGQTGQLQGAISRSSLLEILHAGLFSVPVSRIAALAGDEFCEGDGDNNLEDILCPVNIPVKPPSGPVADTSRLESLHLTAEQSVLYIDMRPYMDPSPHVLLEAASLKKAFTLFRTLGLRHLIIISRDCRVTGVSYSSFQIFLTYPKICMLIYFPFDSLGMVTRKDLIESQLLRQCRRQKRRQRGNSSLLNMSLPTSQQLSPLRLPAADIRHGGIHSSATHHIDKSSEYAIMDHSFGSSLNNSSVRGEDMNEEHAQLLSVSRPPSEESGVELVDSHSENKRVSGKLLDFFFPNNPSSSTDSDRDLKESSGNIVHLSDSDRISADSFGSGNQEISFGRVRLTR